MDHLILARRQDLTKVNKKKKKENMLNSELCRSGLPKGDSERKWKVRRVRRPSKRTEKNMEYESGDVTNYNWCAWLSQ